MQASVFTVPVGTRMIQNGDGSFAVVFLTFQYTKGYPPWDWYLMVHSQTELDAVLYHGQRCQERVIYARPQSQFCTVLAEYYLLEAAGTSSQWTFAPKRASAVYFETTKDVERSITLPLGVEASTEIRGEVRQIPLSELRELGIRPLLPVNEQLLGS